MLQRPALLHHVRTALERSRVVALLGPRQCGKTTLARELVEMDSPHYFDLEDPVSLTRLDEPMTALRDLRELVVIDEVQRRPELFPILRVLADRQPLSARFLVLGSATPNCCDSPRSRWPDAWKSWSWVDSAWRKSVSRRQARHWLRGGFPLSFLARAETNSRVWRKNFVQTFLERDLPQSGITIPAIALLRFWTMLAHDHGQIWNAAEPARSLGVSEPTVRRYLDLLSGMFMIRQLPPWHVNLKKRQVKAPKIYFRDTGLLHQLLGIRSEQGPAESSQVRRVLGRVCCRGDAQGAGTGRSLFLGHAQRSRDRFDPAEGRASVGGGMQACGRAAPDAVDADRAGRFKAGTHRGGVSRNEEVSAGGAGRSGSVGGAGGRRGRVVSRWLKCPVGFVVLVGFYLRLAQPKDCCAIGCEAPTD